MLNVDLHCHSNVSDGVLAPAAVAKYAKAAGVDVWALTDHDEVGGIARARAAAEEVGMRFVPGVEISITWANATVHIVGLQIDADNATLVQGLTATRNGRDARGPHTRVDARHVAAHAVAQQVDGAIGHVMVDDGVEVGHVVGEPVGVRVGALGQAKTAPVGRDHVPVALERVDDELERRGHVHPAMDHEDHGRAFPAPVAYVGAQAAHGEKL